MNSLAKTLVVGVTLLACLAMGAVATQLSNMGMYKEKMRSTQVNLDKAEQNRRDAVSLRDQKAKELETERSISGQYKNENINLKQQVTARDAKHDADVLSLKTKVSELQGKLDSQLVTYTNNSAIMKSNKEELHGLREARTDLRARNAELRLALQEEQAKSEQLTRLSRSLKEKTINLNDQLREAQATTVTAGSTASDNVVLDRAVKGKVTKVEVSGDDTFVQLNVGKSDGLKEGAELTIYNGNTFRATIKVSYLEQRSSVGEVKVKGKTGIKVGDAVMSSPLK